MPKRLVQQSTLNLGFILVLVYLMAATGFTAVNTDALAMSLRAQDETPPMAVVVNGGNMRGISLIDPVTETIFGPFLSGMPGPEAELLDYVVTPDGHTAIVSNCSPHVCFSLTSERGRLSAQWATREWRAVN